MNPVESFVNGPYFTVRYKTMINFREIISNFRFEFYNRINYPIEILVYPLFYHSFAKFNHFPEKRKFELHGRSANAVTDVTFSAKLVHPDRSLFHPI